MTPWEQEAHLSFRKYQSEKLVAQSLQVPSSPISILRQVKYYWTKLTNQRTIGIRPSQVNHAVEILKPKKAR